MHACVLTRVQLFATPWIAACQAPLSMGFPRQEYWSELLFRSPVMMDTCYTLSKPTIVQHRELKLNVIFGHNNL